jgi:hypothetical protein
MINRLEGFNIIYTLPGLITMSNEPRSKPAVRNPKIRSAIRPCIAE